MKCSACEARECERKYENRHKCLGTKEGIECTCTCQVSAAEEAATLTVSVLAGGAAMAGGIAITMLTGGIGYLFGGGALIGAGSSLIMNPIQKQITGEHMTLKDTAQDVALGATIGKRAAHACLTGSLMELLTFLRSDNRANWLWTIGRCERRKRLGEVRCSLRRRSCCWSRQWSRLRNSQSFPWRRSVSRVVREVNGDRSGSWCSRRSFISYR